jgi:hypothetical protein
MPKRLIDDSLLTSPSIASVSTRAQDAFHRFILLADDFGCFDANPRVLVGKGWPLRDDVTERDVTTWLEEYERAGMAQCWEADGRRYCSLTGWFGKHGQKHRTEYDPASNPKGSKRRTPPPPGNLPAVSRSLPGEFPPTQFQSQSQSQDTAAPLSQPGDKKIDPRVRLLSLRLEAVFLQLRGAKYAHGGAKDTMALKRMLGWVDEQEIERRWRASVAAQGFHRCDSFAQLAMSQHWNFYSSNVVSLHTAPTAVGFDPVTNMLQFSDGSTREAK